MNALYNALITFFTRLFAKFFVMNIAKLNGNPARIPMAQIILSSLGIYGASKDYQGYMFCFESTSLLWNAFIYVSTQ